MKLSSATRPALSPALRALLFVPFASVALYGCPEPEETTPDEDEYADVVYGGGATDEALVSLGSALDKAAPLEDPARAPVLDTPTGSELPKSPIPEFSWHFGEAASFSPAAPPGRVPSLLALTTTPPRAREWASPLLELVGPARAAHAHGDPLNGTATFIVFSTKSDDKLVRIFTDQTSFTPGQDIWDELAAANAEITVSLVAADFDNNRIADGGAPVQGTRLTFTIAK